jgi:multidrug efflux pump
MMCAWLLKGKDEERHGRVFAASEKAFQWILDVYETSLRWVLRHQPLTLAVTLATMAATVFLFVKVPKGFFPQQDTGRLSGAILGDQSTSFQAMDRRVAAFVDVVMKDPATEYVQAYTGGSGTVNGGRMFVTLKDLGKRKLSADQVVARLRGKLGSVPGGSLFLQAVQDLRIGGFASNAQYQYTLSADDQRDLETWAPKVLEKLKTIKGIVDLNSDQQTKGLQADITIDRATASRLGISPQQIDDALYDAFGQRQVSTMYRPLNQYHVVMEVDPKYWQDPESLRSIWVKARDGTQVPLSAFTRYARTTAPLAINHQGQFPAVTLSFNLAPGVALGDAVNEINKATGEIGLPSAIRPSYQGTAKAFQESLANEPILILAALLTVYIVLGVLYESLIHPVTILSTLPSAGVGALVALLFTGTDLSVIALIGIILLIGIVKKNAILMIDFAIEAERKDKKSPEDAIFQACLLRFRPITMTTMAALLGGLPLALGSGVGSELRRPLGIAIVGGLVFSQMLTLFTTPVIYLYLDRLRLRWESRRRGRTRKADLSHEPAT